MHCDFSTRNAFPLVDGALTGTERLGYTAHLEVCDECRAEVVASRALCRDIGAIRDPELSPEAARRFDAMVMQRLGLAPAGEAVAHRPARVPARAIRTGHQRRQIAARSISQAARSRRRRFEPLFAPLPSLLLVSLGLAATSVALALTFGEALIRALGGGVVIAAGAAWNRTLWLADGVLGRLFDLVTLADVGRGMFSHAGAWLEATRVLLLTHQREVLAAVTVIAMLIVVTAWKTGRQRSNARAGVRS